MIFPQSVVDYVEADFPDRIISYLGPLDDPSDWTALVRDEAMRQCADIRRFIEGPVDRIVEIGCGLGGLACVMAREFGAKAIHLVDSFGSGEAGDSFRQEMKPWSDVEIAAELVRANSSSEVFAYSPDTLPEAIPADLIVSMKSWGHHYPVETYADFARRSLLPGGVVVLDIRRERDGARGMTEAGFELVGVASESEKHQRMAFR